MYYFTRSRNNRPKNEKSQVQMVTEVFFIEELYLYTEVGSRGRGVIASLLVVDIQGELI
jgi:hypothetical protein